MAGLNSYGKDFIGQSKQKSSGEIFLAHAFGEECAVGGLGLVFSAGSNINGLLGVNWF